MTPDLDSDPGPLAANKTTVAPLRPAAPEGLDVLIAGGLFLALLGAMIGIILLLDPPGHHPLDTPSAKLTLTAIVLLGQNIAILAGAGAASWRRHLAPARLLAFRPLSWPLCLLAILAGAIMGIGLDFAVQLVQHLLGLPLRTPGAELLAPAGFTWTAFATIFVLGALLAPFCEEVLFRGLLFGWLRRRMRAWLAALLSAIPFGIMHVEPLHVLYATVAGFLLALLFHRTGSLWASIIAHVTINAIAIISVYVARAAGVPISQI